MSRTGEWVLEVENERMRNWIMETYGISDEDLDEDSPEWEAMAQSYQNMLDCERDEADEAADAAYDSYREYMQQHPYDQLYDDYQGQQLLIRKLVDDNDNSIEAHMIHKMAFVHAVTLMEALIGDMIKSLVIKHSHLMRKLSLCVEDPNAKRKFTIREIIEHTGGLDGIVLEILSKITFHNIDSTKRILGGIFPETMADLDYDAIRPVIEKRHDFVHRNGKNTKDENILITMQILLEDLETIHQFTFQVYNRIYQSMNPAPVE